MRAPLPAARPHLGPIALRVARGQVDGQALVEPSRRVAVGVGHGLVEDDVRELVDDELLDPVGAHLPRLDEPEERVDVGMRLAAHVLPRGRAEGLAELVRVGVDEEVDRLEVLHPEQVRRRGQAALGDVQRSLGEALGRRDPTTR